MKKKIVLGVVVAAAALLAFKEDSYAAIFPGEETTYVEVVDNREYVDLVIAQVDSFVNIRSGPGTENEVLGKLYDNSVGHFIEESGDWVKIKSGSVTGYVNSKYVVRGPEALKIAREVEKNIATVDTPVLNVRSEATTDSRILGTLGGGEELLVTDTKDGFALVDFDNKTGYISLDYVDIHTEFVEAESIEEERARLAAEAKAKAEAKRKAEAAIRAQQEKEAALAAAAATVAESGSSSSELGQQVIDYACQFIGNPYVYGGTSLTEGCDCSGFVMSVYAHFGVSLPRTGQRNSGYAIASLDEALPGDIICYSGHVGLYMGDGRIVHASTPKNGICTTSATYTKIIGIRRIF